MPTKKTPTPARNLPVPVEMIERRIYLIRGKKVMLDSDLAELYEVETKALNRAVRRNLDRFPEDFMFQLTKEETESLRFQIGTSKEGRGGRRYLPYVFTEQGVAMLSSVLNSERAVQVNIVIMRTFVKLREMLQSNDELNRKLTAIERKLVVHDAQFKIVFDELRKMIAAPEKPRRQIGFRTSEPGKKK
jgi:phage regulator Rha-like protein